MATQSTSLTLNLTHSAAHYLLAIAELLDEHGYARVTDVGKRLGLTRGSVSVALQSLKDAGYVIQDENRFYQLTDTGRSAVAGVLARHHVVELFLTDVLGLPEHLAHRESCRVENLIEGPTARRLQALVDYWRENQLGGVLESRLGPGCPVCPDGDSERCPCCGLECLDGKCPLQAGCDEEKGPE